MYCVFCVYACVFCASRYLCMRMHAEVRVGIDVSRCAWIHLHTYACMYVCTHADKWLLTDCSDDFAARSGRAYGMDSTRLCLSHTPCRRSHVVQVACRTPRASAGVAMALSHNIIVARCRGKRAGYRADVGGETIPTTRPRCLPRQPSNMQSTSPTMGWGVLLGPKPEPRQTTKTTGCL